MTGKTIGIIVARMNSSRLPGKVLRPLADRPLLDFTLERLKAASDISEIWLATTDEASDTPLCEWAKARGLNVMAYTGHHNDVTGRLSAVLDASGATRFVAVLGDTPFVDSRLLTNLLTAMGQHPDWESVTVDQSQGPCVHGGIMCYTANAWRRIDRASTAPEHREHAGSILREKPDLICRGEILDEPLYYTGPYRLTVDTPADFSLATHIVQALYEPGRIFSLEAVLHHLAQHPELAQMNQHVHQKTYTESPARILIAVQAGGGYGLGHLSRCKTIGRLLKEQFAANVSFWLDTPQDTLVENMAEEGWQVTCIEQTPLTALLEASRFDRLLIDFQDSLSRELAQNIRQVWSQGQLIVLDNNGPGCALADGVIYPNVHAEPSATWLTPQQQIHKGSDYVLLGANFLAEAAAAPEPTDGHPFVLVTMGGVDPHQLTEKILTALRPLQNCHIDLVVPPLYPSPEVLEAMATSLPSTITLHWKCTSMRRLMQRATVAIAAFGITAYELAYMGVPTILVGHEVSQLADMTRFSDQGSAISAGNGQDLQPEALYAMLSNLLNQPEQLAAMGQNGRSMVPDAQGAQRVAECIMAYQTTSATETSV